MALNYWHTRGTNISPRQNYFLAKVSIGVLVVVDVKIALWMNEEEESRLVSEIKVQKRVLELMDSKIDNSTTEWTVAMKDVSKAALSEDGSSCVALTKLVELWKRQ